jgi:hypothetical protein
MPTKKIRRRNTGGGGHLLMVERRSGRGSCVCWTDCDSDRSDSEDSERYMDE